MNEVTPVGKFCLALRASFWLAALIALTVLLVEGPVNEAAEGPPTPPSAPRGSNRLSAKTLSGQARRIPSVLPVLAPQRVDWANDEPTRLRRAGLLKGALPPPSDNRAAAGGCTFDIDCEDDLPCTTDRCFIDVANGPGSGFCSNSVTGAGLPGDCDDGLFCNGKEFCDGVNGASCVQGPDATCCSFPTEGSPEYCTEIVARCDDASAIPGARCTADADCGGGKCDHCVPHCANNLECDDGILCNGTETCQNPGPNGVCLPGAPLCGANGAVCSEKRCRTPSGQNQVPLTGCTIDDDCAPGNLCQGGPGLALCYLGRCCSSGTEPACSNSKLVTGQGPACNLGGGSKWYPGDQLRETGSSNTCGGVNPNFPGVQLGCPKYSSGIEQTDMNVVPEHPVAAGPMSQSPIAVQPPNGPGTAFNRIGDDYSLSNASHIELRAIRLAGFMTVAGSILIEFWDTNGSFIEDMEVAPSTSPAVNVVYLTQPLTIPPQGRISVSTRRELGMNSKFVWLSALSVTTGSNDVNGLFVNNDHNAANFMTPSPGILSFELVGEKVAAPLGGCCTGDTCSNTLEWECAGAFQGVGNLCNVCAHAENDGDNCGRCQWSLSTPCDGSEECGFNGPCVPYDPVCTGSRCSNDDGADCGPIGSACPSRPGVCSNADRECVFDSDCPGGACGAAGTCLAAQCAALYSCGVGACCDSGSGACSLTVAGGCGPPDTFLGLGSDCEPNCCWQPADPAADPGGDPNRYDADCSDGRCYTGADNCAVAIVHVIPDLDPADPPSIVTITGDRTFASSTESNPDSCFGPATSVESDFGWWEAFQLNGACTRVRFDYCCTTPAQLGDWAFLAKDCNCNEIVNPRPDPNVDLQSVVGRGAPYCNDDNQWVVMGLMRPGTYYIPVNSTVEDVLGDYTLHIVAEACPDAACCLPNGNCQDGVNQFECDNMGGTFLGPPQRFPPVATCVHGPGGTCAFGSCCVGSGECQDEILGSPIDQAECEFGLGGAYVGGLKCEGGYCVNGPAYSCNDSADCVAVGGGCDAGPGGPKSLAQPNPCPICQFESPASCQLWDNPAGISASLSTPSVGSGPVVADDFIPAPGVVQIDQVCVWGLYLSTITNDAQLDCALRVTGDHFRVRVYRSTLFGLPDAGNIVGESTATAQRGLIPSAATTTTFFPPVDTYGFQLTLDTPIVGLIPGSLYWLEVANGLDPGDQCSWLWSHISDESAQGNRFMATGSDTGGYPAGGELPEDLAWCIGSGVGVETPAEPVRPCCTFDGACLNDTLAACMVMSAEFHIEAVNEIGESLTCGTEFACQQVPECGNGVLEGAEQCDPGPPTQDDNCPGLCQSNCICSSICGNGIREGFEECDGPSDTSCGGMAGRCLIDCICPPVVCGNAFKDPNEECDPGAGSNNNGDEDDDACEGECRLPDDPAGECTCQCGPAPPPELQPVPNDVQKNRFVGVLVPAGATTPTALRVTLTMLNHPRLCCSGQDGNGYGTGCGGTTCNVDANCPGGTPLCRHGPGLGVPNFACFEGETRYVNSFTFPAVGGSLVCADDGPPFNTTYRCATLGCDPEYRDWATDLAAAVNPSAPAGVLYVTGDVLVPSSAVKVEHIAASCGAPPAANTCPAASAPLYLGTAKWGDITGPAFSPPDGKSDVLDIPAVVNKLKGLPTFFSEPRTWLKAKEPTPNSSAVTVVDLSDEIDAVLNKSYPCARASLDVCPGPGELSCVPATCADLPPTTGACCHNDGTCTETTQQNCTAPHVYKGNGTKCLTITQQPQDAGACLGGNATLTIAATGVGTLHYQWKKNGNNIGSDSNTLNVAGIAAADDGASITCQVTDECKTVASNAATLSVFDDPACPACPVPASTLSVVEVGLGPPPCGAGVCGLTRAPDAATQVLAIPTCIDRGACHIEFRAAATRDMQSDPCAGAVTVIDGGGDPDVTAANYCNLVDRFWNGGSGDGGGDCFVLGGTSYGQPACTELHEDAHVTEYVQLLNAELALLSTRPSLASLPMNGNPPTQSCAQAKASRTAAITADVNTAYMNATTAWAAQGEGVNGWAAEFPCATNVAKSICQWAKDQAGIDVDACATCKNGALGTVYSDACGDGIVNQPSEQCDDGNTNSGDGCSATCQTEPE